MNCAVCNIEFESKRPDSRTCSPKCRKQMSRISSVTDNVTLNAPDVTLNFQFTIIAAKANPVDVTKDKAKVRTAKYWYDVPLAAIPVVQKDWPKMPDFMNGRQYFLWWKNDFKQNDGIPEILNPFPAQENVRYEMGGETSRKWGA